MAFRASALKGAVVAAICVVLVASWAGEPAEGSPSCAMHRCIAECPSKCEKEVASSCAGVQSDDEMKCRYFCSMGCKDDCPQGSACCNSKCDGCKSTPGLNYVGCVDGLTEQCKDKCEKECRGEKSE